MMLNFKLLSVLMTVVLLFGSLAYAHEGNFTDVKRIIDAKVSCSELTDHQLEEIGEYYMEQMHPGESHELMHRMMGLEEGSEAEVQFHISMAKTIYCGESSGMDMMGSGGMMGLSGMMGNYQNYGTGWNALSVLFIILLIGLIILIYLAIIKVAIDLFHKKK